MSDYADELDRVSALWDVVYEYMGGAFADIEAGRPTLDELEAGTGKSAEMQAADDVATLREAAHEIVEAALVILRRP
jgi:hypothetical protein